MGTILVLLVYLAGNLALPSSSGASDRRCSARSGTASCRCSAPPDHRPALLPLQAGAGGPVQLVPLCRAGDPDPVDRLRGLPHPPRPHDRRSCRIDRGRRVTACSSATDDARASAVRHYPHLHSSARTNGGSCMAVNEDELGPIDLVVIGYPSGAPKSGEADRSCLISSTEGSSTSSTRDSCRRTRTGHSPRSTSPSSTTRQRERSASLRAPAAACSATTTSSSWRPRWNLERRRGDRVREPLGGAVRGGRATQRRCARRERARRRAGPDRCPRCRRGGGLTERT